MRAAPAALLPYPVAERVRVARRQAAVTHAHPLAQDGAALLCAAVALAATTPGEVIDAEGFCAALSENVTTRQFHGALDGIRDVARPGASPHAIASRLGADITALRSVPTAVALFLSDSDDLETAMVAAVLAGGDTDTIASMTGAITGARTGHTGVPAGLTSRLERAAAIVDLADDLASLGPG